MTRNKKVEFPKHRLYLKVKTVIADSFHQLNQKGNDFSFFVTLGGLCEIRGIFISQKENGSGWTLDLSTVNIRFLDVLGYHHNHPRKKYYLEEELIKAIMKRIRSKNISEDTKISFEPWKPHSLRVPVDFIKIHCSGASHVGNLQIGRHIVLWEAIKFNENSTFEISPSVLSPQIRNIVEEMSKKGEFYEFLHSYSRQISSHDWNFIVGVKGFNPEQIPPPIRFY